MVSLLDDIKRYGVAPHHPDYAALSKALTEDAIAGLPTIDMTNITNMWLYNYKTLEENAKLMLAGPSALPAFEQGMIEARVNRSFGLPGSLLAPSAGKLPDSFGWMYLLTDNWENATGSDKSKGEETRKVVEKKIKTSRIPSGAQQFSFLNVGDDTPADPVRWTLAFYMVVSGQAYGRGKPYGPVYSILTLLTPEGKIVKSEQGNPIFLGLNPSLPNENLPVTTFRGSLPWLYPAILTLMLMQTENSLAFQLIPTDGVAKSYRDKSGHEISRPFYVIVGQDQKTQTEIVTGAIPTIGDDALVVSPGNFRKNILSGKPEWAVL